MSCNQCGDCCRVIVLSRTPEQLAEVVVAGDTVGSAAFIAQHWHPVSSEEALAIFPEYAQSYLDSGHPWHFYTCDQFDPGTNRCLAHETRPPVCSDFPWYGGDPVGRYLHPAYRTCGYRAEQDALIALRRKDGEEV